MNNFEDTLVNPNNAAENYEPLKAVIGAGDKEIPKVTKPMDKDFEANRKPENNSANIFAVSLFTILAVTFLYLVTQTF